MDPTPRVSESVASTSGAGKLRTARLRDVVDIAEAYLLTGRRKDVDVALVDYGSPSSSKSGNAWRYRRGAFEYSTVILICCVGALR